MSNYNYVHDFDEFKEKLGNLNLSDGCEVEEHFNPSYLFPFIKFIAGDDLYELNLNDRVRGPAEPFEEAVEKAIRVYWGIEKEVIDAMPKDVDLRGTERMSENIQEWNEGLFRSSSEGYTKAELTIDKLHLEMLHERQGEFIDKEDYEAAEEIQEDIQGIPHRTKETSVK